MHKTLLVLALGSLSPALFAQQKLDRDIVFVRALAKDMRFIELAREEADKLAAEHRGAGDQDKIAQLAVEIAYYGARSRSDRAQQRTLFKEAIDKSKELVDRSSDPGVQLEARSTLAGASEEFGQFLIEELEIAREQTPDKVKELEEEAATVFRTGIEACGKVMENLKPQAEKDPQKQIEYYLLWMRKAVLQREQARAIKADRGLLIERAVTELSDMVLEAGEETAIGLRGLFEIAQCKEVLGEVDEAIDSYKGTISQIGTALKEASEGKLDLPGEVQGLLFEMMQEVYVRAGDLMQREGRPGTAELFAEFRKNMADFGEKGTELFDVVDPRFGHLMLLAESRFLAESGDPAKIGEALKMVQRINDKHPGDYVGVKAKSLLADILNLQRNLVSGKLLFEVAKGEFQNKNYEGAIKGLRRAIAAMSADEQAQLGLEAYQMLGTSFGLTDRYLEAILALKEGLQKFAANDKNRASDAADTLDRAIANLKRITKNDPFFDSVYAEASNMIAANSATGGSKLFWKAGNDLFTAKKYVESIAEYQKVQADFVFYELAQVRIAKAQIAQGDFAAARATLDGYRKLVAEKPIDARDTAKTQARAQAVTQAELSDVQMLYWQARGSDEFKLQKDPTKYPEALQKLRAFVANFGKDGEESLPWALESIGRLQADLGELALAEEAYTQLKAKDQPRASRLAVDIFKEYQNQEKALTAELDQAIAKNKGEAVVNQAMAKANETRAKLAALGVDYINLAPKPQLAVMVSTLLAFEQIKDWKKLDEIAQKTLAVYGSDTTDAVKKVVDLVVRPKVGEALLQQQKFQQAYDMLVEAEKANPNQWELKRQIARALGGWFEFSNTGAPIRVPGLDRPAEAYQKMYGEYRTWALRPEVKPYSLDWYRFHWECYWFAKQAGVKDGKFKDTAAKFFRIAKATDNFETLKNHGVEGLNLFKYFQINQ